MHHYEGMFILHNRELPEEEAAVTPEAFVTAMVEKCGGTVQHIVPWANRRLAYPIEGNQTGNFLLTYFSGEGDINAKLQREAKIADRCLRLVNFAIAELPAEGELPPPLTEPGARPGDAAATGEIGETVDVDPAAEQSTDPEAVAARKAKARAEKAEAERIDYKNVYHLRRMITSQGKLFSRVRSSLDAKHQRKLRQAVYRARICALLPFVGR